MRKLLKAALERLATPIAERRIRKQLGWEARWGFCGPKARPGRFSANRASPSA